MKSKTLSFVLTLAAALQPAAGFAGGLEQAAFQGGASFGTSVVGSLQSVKPRDLFVETAECGFVDNKALIPYSPDEAVEALEPCMTALSRKLGSLVAVKRAISPAGAGAPPVLVMSYGVRVAPATASSRDLKYSISRRGGGLLGYAIRVSMEKPVPVDAAGKPAAPKTAG